MEDDHPPKGGDDTVVPFLRPVGSVEKSHDAPAEPDTCDDDCESLEDLIETVERGLMASERILKNAEAMRHPSSWRGPCTKNVWRKPCGEKSKEQEPKRVGLRAANDECSRRSRDGFFRSKIRHCAKSTRR
jgi:hypothetical protein